MTDVRTLDRADLEAREAALYWWEPGNSGTIETFPFGTSVA